MAEQFVSKRRLERFYSVLNERTNYIAPVFENLNKPHNASAVIRTGDAMGISRVHFIESKIEYAFNRDITKGTHNWVEHESYPDVTSCFSELRKKNYAIVGTCLHEKAITPAELPIDRPLALVFGNEIDGISCNVIDECDYLVTIPMYGFVESFNISVAAALIMSSLLERLRAQDAIHWKLTEKEKKKMLRKWIYYNTRIGQIVSKKRNKSRMTDRF